MAKIKPIYVVDIPSLTAQKLNDPEVFEGVRDLVQALTEINDSPNALKLSQKIESILGKSVGESKIEPKLYQEYLKLSAISKFVSLINLKNQQIEELFKTKLLPALSSKQIDIMEQINYYLLAFGDGKSALDLINSINKGLSNNEETLGKSNLRLKDGKTLPAYLKNWLLVYNQFTEKTKSRGALEHGNFIARDVNVRKLSEKEKKILLKLLKIYDFLRFPYEGETQVTKKREREEETVIDLRKKAVARKIKKPKKASITVVEPITKVPAPTSKKPPTIHQQIQSAYQGDPKFEQDLAKEEELLGQKVQNNVKILREEFFKAVQLRNQARTIAAFKMLAKLNDLDKFLAEDEKLQKFLAITWAKKYGKKFTDEFEKDPYKAKFIKAFLRYVLEERLDMSENDSARVAAQLANIFKKQGQEKYQKIAYFDLKEKRFKYFSDEEH